MKAPLAIDIYAT